MRASRLPRALDAELAHGAGAADFETVLKLQDRPAVEQRGVVRRERRCVGTDGLYRIWVSPRRQSSRSRPSA
jgi:hypothetical protein